ncbi:hypothetical protein [Halostella salina]|uniref:hypothetical protein n=1 Tax=Halostella salina TaxID=1547897 RepID=UPI000EF7C772|nr:hypothetical protein [Halostella salina]
MTDGSGDPTPTGPLDVPTLETVAGRAGSHPLVERWVFDPSGASPRLLRIELDGNAYPPSVEAARLDVRWFVTDDYSVHYVESQDGGRYECRWDRHPKASAPRTHFHPPPDAGEATPSPLDPHHLDVCFTVLDWVAERVEELHDGP